MQYAPDNLSQMPTEPDEPQEERYLVSAVVSVSVEVDVHAATEEELIEQVKKKIKETRIEAIAYEVDHENMEIIETEDYY